jgi:predicted ester cyclase
MIAEGDMVAERATLRGTYLDKFMGVAATGKKVTGNMMAFSKFSDGKVVGRGRIINVFGMVRQIQS